MVHQSQDLSSVSQLANQRRYNVLSNKVHVELHRKATKMSYAREGLQVTSLTMKGQVSMRKKCTSATHYLWFDYWKSNR